MINLEADGITFCPITENDRDWALFYIFGLTFLHAEPIGFERHLDWIRGRPFDSPDEWLGLEGDRFRGRYKWKNPSPEFKLRWNEFKKYYERTPLKNIDEMLALIVNDELNEWRARYETSRKI
jgi:hypothetical protein